MNYELDYNDQCDLVYGRLRRLANENPEILKADIGTLSELGLEVKGLGLSGEQVQMALDQLKADKLL